MGLMSKIKEIFIKSKSETMEVLEMETAIPGTPTRYGKKLELDAVEKSELMESLTPPRKRDVFYFVGGL
ncbi:MAG TPA: hypothetical protein GXX75_22585 [Clostridiales bacterium]|nr:hypothetical protein [Clostridiales bacterium]